MSAWRILPCTQNVVNCSFEGTVESDDEIPALEEAENVQPPSDANNTAGAAAAGAETEVGCFYREKFGGRFDCCLQVRGKSKQNRSEKKARKAIAKLGLKPFPGVKKVRTLSLRDRVGSIKSAFVSR